MKFYINIFKFKNLGIWNIFNFKNLDWVLLNGFILEFISLEYEEGLVFERVVGKEERFLGYVG